MRFETLAVLAGASAAAANAVNTVTLLLPGFQGQPLQASSVGAAGDTTTYLVNCQPGAPDANCGIPGSGLTAISAPTSIQLMDSYHGTTASLSCDYNSKHTAAMCSAMDNPNGKTTTATGSLKATDLNFMPVTLLRPTSSSATTTSSATSTGSSSESATSTSPATPAASPTTSETPTATSKSSEPSATHSTSAASESSSSVPPSNSSSVVSLSRSVSASPSLSAPVPSTPVSSGTIAPSSKPGVNAAEPRTGKAQWAVGGAALAVALVFA